MAPGFAAIGGAVRRDARDQEILAGQVRLLFANSSVAFTVTVLASTTLSYLQWGLLPGRLILGWWFYMFVVAVARSALALSYRRASPGSWEIGRWRTMFAVGAALAGIGWGGAGVFLYTAEPLINQVFLVFVLGGMMLGAASLLAPRPEAFLAFLLPAGLLPAVRLLVPGDKTHVAMGLLGALFTFATIVTTKHIYRTIDSSLRLQFENRDLVMDLQAAKDQTEQLNQALEIRIHERTSELYRSTKLLEAEVAQREQMEEELFRSRKLESLGLLAGGIAHDFNNFLTIIHGNVEVAGKFLEPGHPAQEMLGQAAGTCQRAAFLSSQLLTFARGGAPVRRAVPLAALVMDAVQLVRAGSPTSISVDIAEDLRFAEVDPGQIGQVLHNVLLNARQAMPDGGTIEVQAENLPAPQCPPSGPRVAISIRDHGCGIPEDVLPRIFDPYFTTKPGGSGLGLATAYSIVVRHEGRITVESKPGSGTVFTIELPALPENPAAEERIELDVQPGVGRILVMDDEAAMRSLLKTVLVDLGYQVQAAADGVEAIALYEAAIARGERFDAVLLDLTVSGGMGGAEAAAKLKAVDPSSKLVVSSGYSDTSVMSDLRRHGFDAVIPKPWTSAQMSMVLRDLLSPDPEHRA